MTIAFIVAALLAGIFFILWQSNRDKLIESGGKKTRLTPELLGDVIKNNGFFPTKKEECWIGFKYQGEQYFISCDTLPGVQFYRGFSYSDDDNLELLKKAAAMAMEETWYGHILFSEEEKTISFRVFAVEKSVEHFTDSFMDYMNMLNNLIECHKYFCRNLNQTQIADPHKDTKILS
jgi:hypothetical protein